MQGHSSIHHEDPPVLGCCRECLKSAVSLDSLEVCFLARQSFLAKPEPAAQPVSARLPPAAAALPWQLPGAVFESSQSAPGCSVRLSVQAAATAWHSWLACLRMLPL